MQWRARAIGEKGTAAEAKLEKAGPFEGMAVRRAMAVVLRVLKETLQDDFSVDRLEMACVDVRACGAGDGNDSGDTGGTRESMSGAAGVHGSSSSSSSKGGGVAAVVVGSSGNGQGLSANGADSAAPPGEAGSSNIVGSNSNRNSGRSGGDGGGGVLETGSRNSGDGSSSSEAGTFAGAPDSFVPRYGYFRRVPKSEMEELLADDIASGDAAVGAMGEIEVED